MLQNIPPHRIAQLDFLTPPPCTRIVYASPPTTTKTEAFKILEPQPVKTPRTISLCTTEGASAIVDAVSALAEALASPEWPDSLLDPDHGYLAEKKKWSVRDSLSTTFTSGELGVSHNLKSWLFEGLAGLLRAYFGESVSLSWQTMIEHSSGATDWGFFVNDKLMIMLELKPSEVWSSLGVLEAC